MVEVSVVVVSWNTRRLLAECLESVVACPPAREIEVWVVDNASSDGSADMVRERFPQVRLIESPTNRGFAAGNNLALRRAEGRYWLLLNPDARVLPGAIEALAGFLDRTPGAGAAAARLLNADGSLQVSCRRRPTVLGEACDLFWLDRLYPVSRYPMRRWDTARPRRVDTAQGACLLLRRQAVEQAGLFDEGYFMYSEEEDLCLRLRRAGWQTWWVPEARVVHLGGQSARQARGEMFLHLYANKVRFFRLHGGPRAAAAYKGILALAAAIRLPGLCLARLPAVKARRAAEHARLYAGLLGRLAGW